jgi:preprotein translocase subunit SecA
MDDLREGIGLRAYGQKDPLLEYKFEAFEMFEAMIRSIEDEVTRLLFHVRVEGGTRSDGGSTTTVTVSQHAQREQSRQRLAQASGAGGGGAVRRPAGGITGPDGQAVRRVGRNDPCPCGSGRKYKRCCGRDQD